MPGLRKRTGSGALRKLFGAPAIAILALVLAFCAASAAHAQIVVIGDSNVAGKGVAANDAYPAKLERTLHAKGYNYTVTNAGVNGDTTQGVLGRLDSSVPQGTKLAIVWVGINDLRAGVPAGTVEAGRQAIAAHLRARGIKVVLLGPRHQLAGQPQYLQGDAQTHLNPAGYDVIVARTLPQIIAALR
jgi:acyl-CoA thioesterase-1